MALTSNQSQASGKGDKSPARTVFARSSSQIPTNVFTRTVFTRSSRSFSFNSTNTPNESSNIHSENTMINTIRTHDVTIFRYSTLAAAESSARWNRHLYLRVSKANRLEKCVLVTGRVNSENDAGECVAMTWEAKA